MGERHERAGGRRGGRRRAEVGLLSIPGPACTFFPFLPTVASTRVSLDIGSSPQKEKGTGDAQPGGSKGEER